MNLETADYMVIIPAREHSTRFPGKPLALISGVPMLVRTWRQVTQAVPEAKVVVVTDSAKVMDLCSCFGINFIRTSATCKTGTDRVAQVAVLANQSEEFAFLKASRYINVQGDEPVIDPLALKEFILASLKNDALVCNAKAKIDDLSKYCSLHVPKVVTDNNNNMVYMSRASIPSNKVGTLTESYYQLGIYSFTPEALIAFASMKEKGRLEAIEDIEILRFIDLGIKVKMINLDTASLSVDLPSDIALVEEYLRLQGLD